MCDTFVALPGTTRDQSVIFAKSADCEVNEANALIRIPRKKHAFGEGVRLTHLVIPQAQETYEVLLVKAWWTYGCEIGVNEYGLAMGEEAMYTTEDAQEEKDGIIGPDLMRIALERARNCQEAIALMTNLLEKYGQGGNCEMSGNSHFDSSFLMADTQEAYVLETAGRKWALKQIKDIGSISNLLLIGADWTKCSVASGSGSLDWAKTYGRPEVPPTLGSPDRQATTYQGLVTTRGRISVKTAFDILRHHGEGYHPATADAHHNICVHAGPQKNRWWQAVGVMVTDVSPHGITAWVTGTSGTCVSIFKPVFMGVELPDIGPAPTMTFNPAALWWKHELLHRRAMADFDHLVPDIRKDFDSVEEEFLAEAETIKKGTLHEKKDFMDYCFRRSMEETEAWIACLRSRHDLRFENLDYRAMWQKLNAEAGLTGMPA